MAENTGIGWTDSTANLWIGCSKVSAACDLCYAEDLMGTEGSRLKRVPWGPKGDRVHCKQGWSDLRKWQRAAAANGGIDPKLGRRRFVFINSLSDFFDNHRSVIWRKDAWNLFRECTHLVLILVTKRPQLVRRELPDFWDEIADRIYILTTAEDQANADVRIPLLLDAFDGIRPPAVLGVSVEPMIGAVDLTKLKAPDGTEYDAMAGIKHVGRESLSCHKLDWVIVGGESGDKTMRPMHPQWPLDLLAQCSRTATPFFFKQWGTWLPAAWIDSQPHHLVETRESGSVGLWPDGFVGHGHADDHGGKGVPFRFQKAAERHRTLPNGHQPDRMLHGRTHQAFPDERMAA